jgi:DNA-directed RNA polymerase specialized sigma24 family protein
MRPRDRRLQREIRVYRLATLLTGKPLEATRVIEEVVRAQPDLAALDDAHLDRLTVLRARELAPGRLADERVPHDVAAALAALPAQQREAFVFARVDGKPQREMARAMDCSVTAAARHLEQAEAAMGAAAGAADAAAALRRYGDALDLPEFYRAWRRRRIRVRRALRGLALLILLAGLVVALRVLLRGR